MNVRPLTLEGIMRASFRDRRLATGYLWTQLLEAARRLWPEFGNEPNEPLTAYPLPAKPAEPERPFIPVWRRSREEDDDVGI